MWLIKWAFIFLMLFGIRTTFSGKNSPTDDEWPVVPALLVIALFVLARDVFLLLRRKDSGDGARRLRVASIVFLTAIVTLNTWAMLTASTADDPLDGDVGRPEP